MKKSFVLLSLFVFVVASFSGCFKKKSAHLKSSGTSELTTNNNSNNNSNNDQDFNRNIESNDTGVDRHMVSPGGPTDDIPTDPSEGKSDKKTRSKSVGKSKPKFTLDNDVSEYESNAKKSSENQKAIAKSKVVVKNPKHSDVPSQPSQPNKNAPKQQASKPDSSQKASGAPKQGEKPAEKKPTPEKTGEAFTKEEAENLKKLAAAFKGLENGKGSKNEDSATSSQSTQPATNGLKSDNEPSATSSQTAQPAASNSKKVDSSQEQQTKPNKVENETANNSLKTNVSSPVESVTLPQ